LSGGLGLAKPAIKMRELVVLVLCFVLYVVAVEVYEARIEVSRQGQLARQEQSFIYAPPQAPVTEDGATIVTKSDEH
jgi:hypothetical protein